MKQMRTLVDLGDTQASTLAQCRRLGQAAQ